MNGNRSREAALEFQDYLASKGLMAKATAMARKASMGKVLAILSEEEAKDVTSLDIEELMLRFGNLQGKSYTPQSLTTYKSRIKSALDDFANYLENPLAFRPSLNKREVKPKSKPAAANTAPSPQVQEVELPLIKSGAPSFDAASILPIPLRQDLIIRIHGLPFDLTESEARKIANVIMAMAT